MPLALTRAGGSCSCLSRVVHARYQRAVDAEPNNHTVLADWAGFLTSEDDMEEADAAYKRSIEGTSTAALVCNYAIFLMEASRYKEAEPLMKRAVELDPTDATVAYNVCCLHVKQGQTANALTWLRKAVLDLHIEEIDWEDPDLELIRNTPEFEEIKNEFEHAGDAPQEPQEEEPQDEGLGLFCRPCPKP